jgi:phosphatidylserine/phosphatidylglycerophosphate/cardiolipin synthase-like enzyme
MWNSPAPIADLKVTVVRSMHLKSYEIDSKLLRTGAANFSASGLKRQDNDLIVIHSANAAAEFERKAGMERYSA